MKQIFFAGLLFFSLNAMGQSTQEQIAEKIATRMKDSLSLTNEQKGQIYTINMQLADQKNTARQQHASDGTIEYWFQKIEGTRDSLYRPILGEEKYQLYRPRKRNLVNNN